MTAEELRKHITAVPFQPFLIRTTDGRSIPVANRDFILVTPTGRHAYVFQRDDSHSVLDVGLLVGVDFAAPPSGNVQPATTNP